MIQEAAEIVFRKWGQARCYTLIDPKKISSPNPGYCFKVAGWRVCGTSKTGKVILELA